MEVQFWFLVAISFYFAYVARRLQIIRDQHRDRLVKTLALYRANANKNLIHLEEDDLFLVTSADYIRSHSLDMDKFRNDIESAFDTISHENK